MIITDLFVSVLKLKKSQELFTFNDDKSVNKNKSTISILITIVPTLIFYTKIMSNIKKKFLTKTKQRKKQYNAI